MDEDASTNVVHLKNWFGNPKIIEINRKLLSLDRFIRSKVIPPQIGLAVFQFDGGKVSLTTKLTTMQCHGCEVTVRGNDVQVRGKPECAYDMYCAIHKEIEDVQDAEKARKA